MATLRPFFIGIVHDLAGSAAATLLLLPFIDDALWAVVYLVVFGVGTMVGMTVITFAIAAPSVYAARRMASAQRWIRAASGAVSLVFGLHLAYKVGIVQGLFTATPRWTPQ